MMQSDDKLSYPALKSPFELGSEKIDDITIDDFKDLKDTSIRESNPYQALKYSAKMAIKYGAPGILMRFKLYVRLITELSETSVEPIERHAMSALKWLLVTEKLCQHHPLAKALITQYLPEEAIDKENYFQLQRQQLLKITRLSTTNQQRSDAEAEHTFHDCMKSINLK